MPQSFPAIISKACYLNPDKPCYSLRTVWWTLAMAVSALVTSPATLANVPSPGIAGTAATASTGANSADATVTTSPASEHAADWQSWSHLASVKINTNQGPVAVGSQSELLIDPFGVHTFSGLISSGTASWQRASEQLNFGFSSSVYWLRLRINNDGPSHRFVLGFDFPLIDDIQLAISQPDGSILELAAGTGRPYENRYIPSRKIYFPLALSEQSTYDLLLRVQSKETIQLRPMLMPVAEFIKAERKEQIIFGLYFGVLAAMLLYNFFLFAVIRERGFGLYLIFLICSGLFIAGQNGFIFEYFLSNQPIMARRMNPVGLGLLAVAAAAFFKEVLVLKNHAPKIDKAMTVLIFWGGLQASLSLFLPFQWTVQGAMIIAPFIMFICYGATIQAYRAGFKTAGFYVVAWSLYFVGSVLYYLKTGGIIEVNPVSAYSLIAGSGFEMIIISVALGYRFNQIRRDKEAALLKANEYNLKVKYLDRELRIGRDLQQAILPAAFPKSDTIDLDVYYEPLNEVGGDYYDYRQDENNGLGLLIADATGHGAGAALLASIVKIAFITNAANPRDTHLVMSELNKHLYGKTKANLISAAYMFFDTINNQLLYTSAGHPSLLYYSANRQAAQAIENQGVILGWQSHIHYTQTKIDFEPGDRYLLYTDGITEARDEFGEPFGQKRLTDVFQQNAGHSLDMQKQGIVTALKQWTGPAQRKDDITFLLSGIKPNHLRFDLKSGS